MTKVLPVLTAISSMILLIGLIRGTYQPDDWFVGGLLIYLSITSLTDAFLNRR